MEFHEKSKLSELLKEYPYLLHFLPTVSPVYKKLQNPLLRKTMVRTATLEMIAEMGDIDIHELISQIQSEIHKKESHQTTLAEERKEQLKDIIRDLHKGKDRERIKQRFAELIKEVTPSEISEMEQSLIDEGIPESEVKRLCDVHVDVFKQSLEKQQKPQTEPGHPIHTFMLENRESEKILHELDSLVARLEQTPETKTFEQQKKQLSDLVTGLSQIDLHYLRKENQLFPLLEKHQVSGPTQVMWGIHDDIRDELQRLKTCLSQEHIREIIATIKNLSQLITDMIYKEEHILYPMSLETLTEKDWVKVKQGEEEIGYAWIQPGREWLAGETSGDEEHHEAGTLPLDTGSLTLQQLNLLLKHLPIDISFVNENDEVAYYSDTPERIFPRSAGVIGRKVQKCHPPKSVHVVEHILKDFKEGTKDVAEFWIQLGGNFIHIRYFAVRDHQGTYQGTLEVSQDITHLKHLQGERRLLDWG